MRDLLKRLDTDHESKIPVSDVPRTTVGEPLPVTAAPAPEPAAAEDPAPVAEDPLVQEPESQPELLPMEQVASVPPTPVVTLAAPVVEEPKFVVEPQVAPVQAELPNDPPMNPEEDQSHPQEPSQPLAEEEHVPSGDFDGVPPPSDDDAPPEHPADEFVDFGDIMLMDQSPVIHSQEDESLPQRRSSGPAPAQPGQRPFPPSLEPKRWYRMLLDETNRPIAILDNSRDKAVHTYTIPPERLTFKIDLSSVVQGAAATFRSPLPVSELADRLEGKKFCFECQPGADGGNEVVMKIVSTEPPPEGKQPKEEILRSKVFKGPKGQPPMSSLPALASGHQSLPRSAPALPGGMPGKDLASQMLWLDNYRASQRGKRG